MVLLGYLVNSSWYLFIGFMWRLPNKNKDDESFKEYFYRGHDDNGKVVLDVIARGHYGNAPLRRLQRNIKGSPRTIEHEALKGKY